MYIILGTVIVIVIVIFWKSVYSLFSSHSIGIIPTTQTGIIWFIALLIINITFVIFIYVFYYYKSSSIGKAGNQGEKGVPGLSGDGCIITFPQNQFYAPYNGFDLK